MPLDPVIQALFAQMPNLANYPMWELSPAQAREEFRKLCQFADPKDVAIGKTENITMPGPAGPLPLRVYTPVAAGGAAIPCLIYLHGGGFVIGDLDCYDGVCRSLANESGCKVISVGYRLAPEHPFPAAVEDCYAAVKWVETNAGELGVDPTRLAVGGDSAGGNLAAVVCQIAKSEKGGPHIVFQLLIYPVLALKHGESAQTFSAGFFLTTHTIQWFSRHYLPAGTDMTDVRIAPLAAKDLAGLPPAYIVTAGFDPLRDEAVEYAEKLKAAGVAAVHVDYPSMIHGFFSMQGLIPLAPQAVAAAGQALKDALK